MRDKGLAIETLVKRHLISHGLTAIQSNFTCKLGEIDLIMKDGNELTFIEVRYRTSNLHGTPEETINQSKIRKIIKAASYYLHKHNLWDTPCRFDVVGVTPATESSQTLNFHWIKAAFSAET